MNKKISGAAGKIKKGKYTSNDERPPPVGFEELSSIHQGLD